MFSAPHHNFDRKNAFPVMCRNLKNMELVGKQDPYCQFAFGKTPKGSDYKKKTKTVKKGGRNPYFKSVFHINIIRIRCCIFLHCSAFREEELLFWVSQDNWHNDLVLTCYDEDVGSDDLIGVARFSILPYMIQDEAKQELIQLRNKKEETGRSIVA